MTDEEAQAIARRAYAVSQKSPELKLLTDWLIKTAPRHTLLPIWDCIGCNIERVRKTC